MNAFMTIVSPKKCKVTVAFWKMMVQDSLKICKHLSSM